MRVVLMSLLTIAIVAFALWGASTTAWRMGHHGPIVARVIRSGRWVALGAALSTAFLTGLLGFPLLLALPLFAVMAWTWATDFRLADGTGRGEW